MVSVFVEHLEGSACVIIAIDHTAAHGWDDVLELRNVNAIDAFGKLVEDVLNAIDGINQSMSLFAIEINDKLIAAKTHDLESFEYFLHDAALFAQDLVTHQMAEVVVDAFEVVAVEDGKDLSATTADKLADEFLALMTIVDACERIVMGDIRQLRLLAMLVLDAVGKEQDVAEPVMLIVG